MVQPLKEPRIQIKSLRREPGKGYRNLTLCTGEHCNFGNRCRNVHASPGKLNNILTENLTVSFRGTRTSVSGEQCIPPGEGKRPGRQRPRQGRRPMGTMAGSGEERAVPATKAEGPNARQHISVPTGGFDNNRDSRFGTAPVWQPAK